jgi:hypothetical protein
MAVVKNHVAVLDGPNQAGVFSDRVVAAQQLGIAASGTNPAIVVTFTEPLPANYTRRQVRRLLDADPGRLLSGWSAKMRQRSPSGKG